MADAIPRCMSAALIQKLHALAERRCAHLIELRESGRWTRYYSRKTLVEQMKDATQIARHWQQMLDMESITAVNDGSPMAGNTVDKISADHPETVVAVALRRWRSLNTANNAGSISVD
jgi:uncharacterized repeat protein (TIGR03809 family)